MPIEYKRLTENELDIFIEMRINQLREEGAKEDIDLKPALKDYYSRHMTEGTFVSWIAVDGNKIIGTSGMSFVEKPPYFSCPSGKIGLLSSMFTEPDYRRMGIAKELLHRVIEEVHLPPARHLAQNRVANHAVVVVNHARLHRQAFLRRRFQHRHIADADHRHVQRARNRRGGERQHIHLMLHVLDDFLMLHAKSLLLVHNQQTEVLELHVFAQNAVRTDKDVDFALLHAAQNVLGFLRRA